MLNSFIKLFYNNEMKGDNNKFSLYN